MRRSPVTGRYGAVTAGRGRRRAAQPVRAPHRRPDTLNGTIIRVDPATGAGVATNPCVASTDPNKRRVLAYGLRNPFRFTTRPGTNELWIGDVGWDTWEEIDRVADTAARRGDELRMAVLRGGLDRVGLPGGQRHDVRLAVRAARRR